MSNRQISKSRLERTAKTLIHQLRLVEELLKEEARDIKSHGEDTEPGFTYSMLPKVMELRQGNYAKVLALNFVFR